MARRASLPPEIEAVAAMGWHLYPSVVGSKAACFPSASDAATSDADILRDWYHEFHQPNWRLVFGPSGLIGLDLDVPPGHSHDGVAGLKAIADRHGGIPPRPTARSGGGGLGLFWTAPAVSIRGDAGHPAPGCDPRRGRQSQTIPPSTHWRTGNVYHWIIPPWDCPPPECPPWLVDLIREPPPPPIRRAPPPDIRTGDERREFADQMLRRAIGWVVRAPAGAANNTLNSTTHYLAREFLPDGSLTEAEITYAMEAAAGQRFNARDRGSILPTIRSALRSHR